MSTLKRGTAVLWSCGEAQNRVTRFAVVKAINDDCVEIEIIEPEEQKTILASVPHSELQPL